MIRWKDQAGITPATMQQVPYSDERMLFHWRKHTVVLFHVFGVTLLTKRISLSLQDTSYMSLSLMMVSQTTGLLSKVPFLNPPIVHILARWEFHSNVHTVTYIWKKKEIQWRNWLNKGSSDWIVVSFFIFDQWCLNILNLGGKKRYF